MLPRRLSVFPEAGGSRPALASAPHVPGYPYSAPRKQERQFPAPPLPGQGSYPPIPPRSPHLWITHPAILASDEVSPPRGEYDRDSVALLSETLPPRFAHDSEAELARVLDFYQVSWRYEPDVFPISWSPAGAVIESFAPDFYLPELELYVELTTLRQTLVRKKNRKLRLLRQLYPEVRVKLLYARDFRALMVKYGRLAFLLEMNGANGNGANGNGPNGHPQGKVAAR